MRKNDYLVLPYILIGITGFFTSCTRPPALQFSSKLTNDLFFSKDETIKRIYGFGDLTVSIEGRRYNGSIDIDWKNRSFQASAYSPFGSLVAAISSDSFQGVVSTSESVHHFSLDGVPDSLPFMLGEGLTFRDFIFILTGRLPDRYNDLNKAPDTVLDGKRSSRLIWRVDSVEIVAHMNKKSNAVSRLEVRNSKNKSWHLFLNGINQRLARSIELKVDDKNYFSVRYERLKLE